MQRTLIVHHRSGIGDLVWHLPYIRAIARSSEKGKVTIMARPSCRATDILAGEECVEEVIEYDHRPRNKARGRHDGMIGQIQFLLQLRNKKFDRIFIFSNRVRYGILAMAAGIPVRAGFGFGMVERFFLNFPPYIDRHKNGGSWVYPEATNFAIAHGFADSPILPKIQVPISLIDKASEEMSRVPRPRYAFAIGSSEAKKNWGGKRFLELAKALLNAGCGVLFLGGPAEREYADNMFSTTNGLREGCFQVVCQPSVLYTAAVLKSCDFCIGNDTGVLNIAVACDVPALGLFGRTPPLTHDPLLHAISGQSMDDFTVESILDCLAKLGAPAMSSAISQPA